MNIHHYLDEIKRKMGLASPDDTFEFDENGRVEKRPLFKKLFLSLVIILVAGLSFGLGKLSNLNQSSGIKIEYTDLDNPEEKQAFNGASSQTASVINAVMVSDENVVVSSKGTKYHYPYCSGAKQISETNKVVFASAQAAEAAGYTLAANCKPK
ncbi:MAG: hypothetical protein ABIF06_00970 [bacterium]